ncbi:hypothetical protein PENSPDRAFT_588311 [Peniophora sp. CONT]|nr:hypothetical protein PENSPDRAFT_588311 [Peniophora sp. CONT]
MDSSQYLDNGFYPPTPSYNGSYANSPFSVASELDFDSKFASDEYDPAAYDNPGSAGLLTFNDSLGMFHNDSSHVAVSVTPALDDALSPQYYDHSSPASSNGGETSEVASSVSSHHPQISQQQSPHLNFTGLQVNDSPYMANAPSPPQLVIPDQRPQAPAINAPEGNGAGDGGPRLHIVPATPISGTDPPQQAAFAGSLLGSQSTYPLTHLISPRLARE